MAADLGGAQTHDIPQRGGRFGKNEERLDFSPHPFLTLALKLALETHYPRKGPQRQGGPWAAGAAGVRPECCAITGSNMAANQRMRVTRSGDDSKINFQIASHIQELNRHSKRQVPAIKAKQWHGLRHPWWLESELIATL
jgi:hypothetical protein